MKKSRWNDQTQCGHGSADCKSDYSHDLASYIKCVLQSFSSCYGLATYHTACSSADMAMPKGRGYLMVDVCGAGRMELVKGSIFRIWTLYCIVFFVRLSGLAIVEQWCMVQLSLEHVVFRETYIIHG